jgi:hypothetical protein
MAIANPRHRLQRKLFAFVQIWALMALAAAAEGHDHD